MKPETYKICRVTDYEVWMFLSEENEQALITQAKLGSSQALATLLQANYAVVYRYLLKLTVDPQAAEDAAQDAMERAIRNFQTFDPSKAKLSTWMITIARNRWLDELRKNKWLTPLVETDDIDSSNVQDPLGEIIEQKELLQALNRMDAKARTPITMCYMLGYSYDEIAKFMKIPLGTVKSRISNGIKQLRRELGKNET
jgi:RNA polymerase sigma-70 factor, ECF subfamily